MKTMVDSYSERLTSAMSDKNVGEADLAKRLGISRQAVKKAMAGGSNAFSAENNAKAAKYLDVNPDWLALGGSEPRHRVFGAPAIPAAKPSELLRDLRMRLSDRTSGERKSVAALVSDYLASEQESVRTLDALGALIGGPEPDHGKQRAA